MIDNKYVIGVDVGGGHISASLVELSNHTIVEGTRFYEHIDSSGSKQEVLADWANVINQCLKSVNQNKLEGIAFAMPGPFNYREGIAKYERDKYTSLNKVCIPDELRPYLNLEKEVDFRFLNDATAFAVAEAWVGEASDVSRSVSITLGTGFGSAFIENGIPVTNRQDVPEAGCLWHLPYKDGIVEDYFSTQWFLQTALSKFGKAYKGVKELADLARKNTEYQELFEEYGHEMGTMLAPWFKKFGCEALVVGGNISRALDMFSPAIQDVLSAHALQVSIRPSNLMEDGAMIGSSLCFKESFWEQIKADLPMI